MFIKRTRGGSPNKPIYYLQIVKAYREGNKPKHKVICTLGREDELVEKGFIDTLVKKLSSFSKTLKLLDLSKECLGSGKIYGPLLILEKVWKKLEMDNLFNQIIKKSNIEYDFIQCMKLMVFNRLKSPKSKLSTDSWKDKLHSEEFKNIKLHHLYRTLDVLIDNKEKIEDILFGKTMNLFHSCIDVVFYDLTTIYFESTSESEIKRFGYSKDNKTDSVQVVLALLMSKDNMPLGYEIFPGNTFEGKTVLNALGKLKKRFKIDRLIFVSDKGLLSKKNLEEIEENGYEYIMASKLRMLPKEYHEEILNVESYEKINDEISGKEIKIDNKRHVLGYSKDTAKRDSKQREILIARLEKKIKQGIKSLIGKPAYSKYLSIKAEKIEINNSALEKSAKWDGIFGFVTNNKDLSRIEIIESYRMLWQIEEAFRCMKTVLEIRPVYHYSDKRIEGHILLCFISFYIHRYMQRILLENQTKVSVPKMLESLLNVEAVKVKFQNESHILRTEISGDNLKYLKTFKVRTPSIIVSPQAQM